MCKYLRIEHVWYTQDDQPRRMIGVHYLNTEWIADMQPAPGGSWITGTVFKYYVEHPMSHILQTLEQEVFVAGLDAPQKMPANAGTVVTAKMPTTVDVRLPRVGEGMIQFNGSGEVG